MEPIIQARHLVKRYNGLTATDGISFSIYPGECFGVLGPNGAGKTTTVKMITCIVPVTSGELRVDGLHVDKEPRKIKSLMGVVPQEESLDPDLTVQQNLVSYARYFNVPKALARERIMEALALFQLLDKKDSQIYALSGGMKRRLLIARALLHQPKILVLDEPTTGLDPQARHLVWDKLQGLKAQGITILLCTHYMEEANYLCDRLVIMDAGKILVEGRPRDLVEEYAGREVLELRPQPQEREMVLSRLRERGLRLEDAGSTIYAFIPNGDAPVADLDFQEHLSTRRAANLEDVFLRLTGRSLREE